jgi:chromatin assembly factor 1 subunit A
LEAEKQAARLAKKEMAEAAKQEKEEKRRRKEEEDRKLQEEKTKKERSQLTLGAFFKTAPATPTKVAPTPAIKGITPQKASPTSTSPGKSQSNYELRFKPFFVKEHVRMAPYGGLDDEKKANKARMLDEHIRGRGGVAAQGPFDPVELFHIHPKPARRGRLHRAVRDIVRDLQSASQSFSDAATRAARDQLRRIPMKIISFSSDVRPPYYGTMTLHPQQLGPAKMVRAARRPITRRLELAYDYDSEAEWQDDELGEDLDDLDDDEDDADGDEGMDEFLDDSEDAGLLRRVFANSMEPESTGLCFENEQRRGPVPAIDKYKMEFILSELQQPCPIGLANIRSSIRPHRGHSPAIHRILGI